MESLVVGTCARYWSSFRGASAVGVVWCDVVRSTCDLVPYHTRTALRLVWKAIACKCNGGYRMADGAVRVNGATLSSLVVCRHSNRKGCANKRANKRAATNIPF